MKLIRKKELKSLHDEIKRLKAINEGSAVWQRRCIVAERAVKELKVEIEEVKKDGVMSQVMPLTKDMTHKEIEHRIDISFFTLINYASSFLGIGIKDLKYNIYTETDDCGVYVLEYPISSIDIKFNKAQYKPTKINK